MNRRKKRLLWGRYPRDSLAQPASVARRAQSAYPGLVDTAEWRTEGQPIRKRVTYERDRASARRDPAVRSEAGRHDRPTEPALL